MGWNPASIFVKTAAGEITTVTTVLLYRSFATQVSKTPIITWSIIQSMDTACKRDLYLSISDLYRGMNKYWYKVYVGKHQINCSFPYKNWTVHADLRMT